MSVHIHNGFKINATSLLDAGMRIQDFADRQAPVAIEHACARLLMEHAVNHFDLVTLQMEPAPEQSYLEAAQTEMIRRQKSVLPNVRHDDDTDYAMDIAFYEHAGQFYGIFFTDCAKLSDAFMARDDIKDFGWQNGSDRPNEVTEEEWSLRESVWRAILKDFTKAPLRAGQSIKVSTVTGSTPGSNVDRFPMQMPSLEALLIQLPTHEWRVNQVAMIPLLEANYKDGNHKVTGEKLSIQNFIELRKGPEFKKSAELMMSKIAETIEIEDLFTVASVTLETKRIKSNHKF